MVDIVIDGRKTTVPEGETILEAARGIGVDIPVLCFHQRLRPHRACRVCTVEVIRGDKTSLLAACSFKVTEPMVVNTRSEGALSRRREIVGGLLSAAPGAPALAQIARQAGVGAAIDQEGERCIRCGLCVRVCDEVIGQKALTYDRNASGTPYVTASDACIGCATCAVLCPTGAIVVREGDGKRRFVQADKEFSLVMCRRCGRPITTEPHLALIRQKRDLTDDVALVCPSCKRDMFAEKIAAGGSTAAP